MNVNPGELNKRIKIIKIETEKDNDRFTSKKTENVVRNTWAKITRVKVSEVMRAETEINLTRCRFLVRYSPKPIDHTMFILYAGVYYQIEYVNNYGDSNEYIEIMATAGEK
ncbi:MAG: phage head closure protein [Lachnospiraceae bacterium]|nr:phage head closure protein [Lachnospiraceae bacterium]